MTGTMRSLACSLMCLLALLTLGGCGTDEGASVAKRAGAGEAIVPGFFRDVAEEVGLRFHHFNGATGDFLFPEIAGSGVALLDYDSDGALDILVLQCDFLDRSKRPADALFPPKPGFKPGVRLFRNELIRTGKLQFTDVTEQAGIRYDGCAMGVAVGDYDNDGYPDVLITGFGGVKLFHNNGNGTFTDVTAKAGLDDPHWSTSAAFVELNRNGLLDLIIVHYVDFSVRHNPRCTGVGGERDYCGPQVFRPVPSRLYRNVGGGKFVDVTRQAGLQAAYGAGLGVAAADFDGDGWIDLYVANDGNSNQLWINRRHGTFEDRALVAGAALSSEGKPKAGMGVAVGDVANDGNEDIFITNMVEEGNTLHLNDGKGFFRDATREFGLFAPSLSFTGFGTGFFDYDNDGFLDLFVANGAVKAEESQRGTPWPYRQKNQLYRNVGGRKFIDVSEMSGPGLQLPGVGRGAAFGDLNNDGKIDIVISNNNGPIRVLLNETVTKNHYLQVLLEGTKSNRMGLGARVAVLRQNKPPLWRRAHTDGSYLSASDHRVHFGLGADPAIRAVVVIWPTGEAEAWEGVQADRLIKLREGSGRAWPVGRPLVRDGLRAKVQPPWWTGSGAMILWAVVQRVPLGTSR